MGYSIPRDFPDFFCPLLPVLNLDDILLIVEDDRFRTKLNRLRGLRSQREQELQKISFEPVAIDKVKQRPRRSKIDWSAIKVKIVTADKDHPNKLNPYTNLSSKERAAAIVTTSARIWVRYVRSQLSKAEVQAADKQPSGEDRNTVPVTATQPESILSHASIPAEGG
jgi:hypothetical protein